MTERLADLVRALPATRVVVVGDYMLDHYVWGSIERVSPEAPVHVLDVRDEEDRPGGAGNVALNLLALGAEVVCLGLRGSDDAGRRLAGRLKRKGAEVDGLLVDKDRRTTVKTRMLAASQQVLRVDRESRDEPSRAVGRKLLAAFRRAASSAQAVIVSDYAKGTLAPDVATGIIAECRRRNLPVLVDPHRRKDYGKYRGCSVLKPNVAEAAMVLGAEPQTDDDIAKAGAALRRQVQAAAVVLTRGAAGLSLIRKGRKPSHVRGLPRQVYDVTGAGDTVIATLAWCLAAGAPLGEAAELANVAASVVVGKVGSATVTRDELVHHILDVHHAAGLKIVRAAAVGTVLEPHRARGERIVFTNGCFDLMHVGHIRAFQFAKGLGDLLVVGLNTDASVRRLKGPGRPVLQESDRAQILGALEAVDYIVLFDESTPLKLLKRVRPDVLVKGKGYTRDTVVGADFVESLGGEVVIAPAVDGVSTTDILDRVRNAGGG